MKEREVKLSASEDFELPEIGRVHGAIARPRTDQVLSTVYFDSDDFRLARWRLSLRHRGGQGWTVKLPSDGTGDLLVRDEIVFKGRAGTPPAAADLVKGYMRTQTLRAQVRLRTVRRGVLCRVGEDLQHVRGLGGCGLACGVGAHLELLIELSVWRSC